MATAEGETEATMETSVSEMATASSDDQNEEDEVARPSMRRIRRGMRGGGRMQTEDEDDVLSNPYRSN
jgi:hypothetical protein